MKDSSKRAPLNAQIYEEACEWFLKFRMAETDVASRAAFDRWMRRSPEHIAAYLEVAAVWNDPAARDARGKWNAETLIAQACSIPSNVLPLASSRGLAEPAADVANTAGASARADAAVSSEAANPSAATAPSKHAASPCNGSVPERIRQYALAAALALAVACSLVVVWYQAQGTIYRTALGEQRSIRLADGSIVDLNSKTVIRVRYRTDERNIDIRQGQAFFKVVADRTRPFVVESNGTRVRAVGTQFDVYRKTLGTVVTVVEGSVAVRPPTANVSRANAANRTMPMSSISSSNVAYATDNDSVVLLKADEQVTVTPDAPPQVSRGTASMAVAWIRRKIVFSGASLTEVAEEFNRYSARRLIVEHPGEYDFRVSGVFSSADVTSIVRFLRTRPDVEVEENAFEIRIRKKPA